MQHCLLTALVGLSLIGVSETGAPGADWPMFIGDGDRTPPKQGTPLVDHLDDAPAVWKLHHHMGVGKGLYPGELQTARAHGIEPFYGGTATPIVAGGTVFVAYFKPNGKVPAKREQWRTMGEKHLDLLPKWFFSVTADDMLVAIDAATGKIRWEAAEKNKGHNRLGHKRGHWGISPAYADGRVFSMGTAGRLYAYDARSGRKLWDVIAEPGLQKQLEEYLQKKLLCWHAGEKSSLVVAAGNVIVPHGRLTAYDAKTGKQQWSTDEDVLSGWSTPAFWHDQGRTYLLVNGRAGSLRLIDPDSGKVLWTLNGLGNQLGTVTVTGDIAMLNAGSQRADNEKSNGLFGAFRLSLNGANKLWILPDKPEYRHSWTMDRGAERRTAIQDGNVYMIVGLSKEDRLVVADVKSGRILSEQPAAGLQSPWPLENRLLVYDDRAHADPVTASWYSLDDPARPKNLHGSIGFGPRTITGYEVPIAWPYVDGVLYARTMDGMAAFDLRKAPDTEENRTLHMTIPGKVVGTSRDLDATLTQRGGKLSHGGFRSARRLRSIDTSRAQWDGKRLIGTLGIDVTGFQQPDTFEIDAAADEAGRLTGTITSRLAALDKPVERSGKITAMEHQDWWMPPADHVLWLENAAIQETGKPGRLLLYVRADGGKLVEVRGMADHTTKAMPVVDGSELRLANGRLSGTVRARYRADEWAEPLGDGGGSAAGEYTVDAKLVGASGEQVGIYKGTYGTEWEMTCELLPASTRSRAAPGQNPGRR